eukprot:767621-Prorocentrum_minimum.AAC.2
MQTVLPRPQIGPDPRKLSPLASDHRAPLPGICLLSLRDWSAPREYASSAHAISPHPCQGALGIQGGEWQPTWQTTESSKVAYLLDQLRALGLAPPSDHPAGPHSNGHDECVDLTAGGSCEG